MNGYSLASLWLAALASALPDPVLSQPASTEAPAPLEFVSEVQLSPRLREITLRTPALATPALGPLPANPAGQTRVRILLPEGYDPKADKRYPVLYLYHGGGGNQAEWTTPTGKGDAEGLSKGMPLIIVMPEGGMAGGYADWYNGGAHGPPRWKTYHLDQLIPWVDANFHTIAHRSARATAGLSMGGGGLRYAEARPDLIGVTAAFSGDIDILQPASDWVGMGAPISKMIWGDRKDEEVRWRGENGPDLAKNLSNTDVAIFTGDSGRPEGVYILQGATAVHDRLAALGISHRFKIYPGMTHSWPTWNKALAEWLPHLMNRFSASVRSGNPELRTFPSSFSYSSIKPAYSLFGWDVALDRKVVEFSAIEVAGSHRFTIIGSGKAVVNTPTLGWPNAEVRAAIVNRDRPELNETLNLKADAQGRVTVPVRLGPANQFQQYSAQARATASGTAPDKVPFLVFDNGSRFYSAEVRLTVR